MLVIDVNNLNQQNSGIVTAINICTAITQNYVGMPSIIIANVCTFYIVFEDL